MTIHDEYDGATAPSLPEFDPDFASPADWANFYRAIGWAVVPAWLPREHKNFKHPKLATWSQYQAGGIPQEEHERWYGAGGEHVGRANMGTLTGEICRLLMIDLDTYKSPKALAWWRGVLEAENSGIEPETVRQKTGGGGLQLFFTIPADWRCRNATTDLKVDIRCDGGFTMLPPSLHDSGDRYAWEPGFAPWEVAVAAAEPWLLDAVRALVEAQSGGGGELGKTPQANGGVHTQSPDEDYTPFGSRQDGRETEMYRTVWHHVLEWFRECPILPPVAAWEARAEAAYQSYEAKVVSRLPGDKAAGLEREDRGRGAFARKWRATMRHWGSPRMAEAAAKPAPEQGANRARKIEEESAKAEERAKTDPAAIYPYLDVRQIKATADPCWLVEGAIAESVVGFIFGPPGGVKTFIALDLGLSIATSAGTWWNRPLGRRGGVVYISSEGIGSLKFRVMAWEIHRKLNADDAPFYLIKETINFMDDDDIGKLVATVQAIKDLCKREIIAVFVDTVSRVLPGSDENLQKDMTHFIAGCDAVRQRFGATVIGLHHTNKAGDFRGSSVMLGAGDFLLKVQREPGAMKEVIHAQKVKDAKDGWEQSFKITEIDIGDLLGHTSLVVDEVTPEPRDSDDKIPEREICREILSAINEEWHKRRPWCWAQNSSRSAVRNISVRWQIDRETAKYLLEQWTANGVIAEQDCSGTLGYQKLSDL